MNVQLKEEPAAEGEGDKGGPAFLGIPAAQNPNIPPFTTTNASATLVPLFVQFAK